MKMQRIYTERAHLMCPNMFFGIVISVDAAFDRDKISEAVNALSEAHPFLRALLGKDDDGFFYDVTGENQTKLIFKDIEVSGAGDEKILHEYEGLTKKEWDLRKEGMLKVMPFRNGGKTVFLFVFHHLLADGRGAFLLTEEFAKCCKTGDAPAAVEEQLISSKKDMPENSALPFVSRLLVRRANKKWRKEGHALSYEEYIRIADKFLETDEINRSIRAESSEVFNEMITACREHGVSVNDYLMARMYINDKTDKIIIAYDLRDKLSCYRKGALGNYSTAFSVEYKSKTDDVWKAAQDIHALVQKKTGNPKNLYLVLQCYADLDGYVLDAAFAAARCGYESEAAKFIGSMFFGFTESKGYSITNLGKFDSSNIEEAVFLPPASPAIRKTLGVLTVNGKMFVSEAVRR